MCYRHAHSYINQTIIVTSRKRFLPFFFSVFVFVVCMTKPTHNTKLFILWFYECCRDMVARIVQISNFITGRHYIRSSTCYINRVTISLFVAHLQVNSQDTTSFFCNLRHFSHLPPPSLRTPKKSKPFQITYRHSLELKWMNFQWHKTFSL